MEYNGWHNHETWLVNLCLRDDEVLYGSLADILGRDRLFHVNSLYDKHARATLLQQYVEESIPLPDDSSLYSDLLRWAISEVDWLEIIEKNTAGNTWDRLRTQRITPNQGQ